MVDGKLSLKELRELEQQLLVAPGGGSWLEFDGVTYDTDWGYAYEGIDYFLSILERRIRKDQNEC